MEPLAYLLSLEQIGIKFGLDNIGILCESLGRPQDAFRSIIIAGTNGKGSVTAMVEHALRAAGLRSARYTSPHLVRLEERFFIHGQPIDTASLLDVTSLVRSHIESLLAHGTLAASPTFFEVTTAIAFELFRRTGVEMAVLEVGLGGRLDATNIVSPIAAAITSIDLDHETYLGHSLAEIAREKAGVIKPGIPVVVGGIGPDADEVVRSVCDAQGASYIRCQEGVRLAVELVDGRAKLDLTSVEGAYRDLRLALRGRHQVGNALVALRLLETLRTRGVDIPADAIRAGLSDVTWRGRLDLMEVASDRRVLLDAAHNPAGAAVLAEYLREVHPRGVPIVFAAMRDKDAEGMLRLIAPSATRLIMTEPANPRASTGMALARRTASLGLTCPIEIVPSPWHALERAWRFEPLACAAGSIFLVGELIEGLASRTGRGS